MGGPVGPDSADACPGPHVQCVNCYGEKTLTTATLYVSPSGRASSAPGAHTCWHCKGRGWYCRAADRCTPPHDA